MIADFLNLQQDNRTVTEYAVRFTRLSRFATYIVDTEDKKARKFEGELKDDFKTQVKLLKLPTYAEVLDRALILESDEKEFAKRRDHKRARGDGSNQFQSCNEFHNRNQSFDNFKKQNREGSSVGSFMPRGGNGQSCSVVGKIIRDNHVIYFRGNALSVVKPY
ncbi:hypothetical protein RHGRI_028901 [Rhododendron griersonianum]|uniref:Retrotransposon gag domain-containing protein n=1 Tax=Rhododendron griersonianum TaxID=479676 RepID=A0AAV6IN32_9ERIC|nr:hypothetical protein RHGRI_028901 [Rhododendron griersonianum]